MDYNGQSISVHETDAFTIQVVPAPLPAMMAISTLGGTMNMPLMSSAVCPGPPLPAAAAALAAPIIAISLDVIGTMAVSAVLCHVLPTEPCGEAPGLLNKCEKIEPALLVVGSVVGTIAFKTN